MTVQRNVFRIVLIITLFVVFGLHAAEIAKYAGEFMSTGVGARGLAMGSAYVAVGGDVTFGYWNPAGLARIRYPELAGMHSRRFEGIVNYDYIGFATPFRATESLGMTMIRTAVDDIPITALPRPDLDIGATFYDNNGKLVANRPYIARTVNDAEYAFYLSYAKARSTRMSYGANVKFVRKGVGDNSAWGIGFDIGALWNPVHSLLLGFNFQDVTTTLLAWDTGRRELISPTLKTGVGYPFRMKFLSSEFMITADADFRFEGRRFASQAHVGDASVDFHAGGEMLLRHVVALRLGHDVGHFAAGAGIKLPRLDVDYAFLQHEDLGVTHRVSLRLRLEEAKFLRK